jgi:Na+-driven multidrug efflux pump
MGNAGVGTATLGYILGLIAGWIILRRGRRPIQFDVPAIAWVEKPVAIWKQGWSQALFVFIHSLSILLIAFLFLLDRKVPSEFLDSSRVTSTALWVVWMIAGSVFSFSFIYPFAGQMPVVVFSNAFARG